MNVEETVTCVLFQKSLGRKEKRKVISVDKVADGTHGPHPQGAFGPLGKMDIQTDYAMTVWNGIQRNIYTT